MRYLLLVIALLLAGIPGALAQTSQSSTYQAWEFRAASSVPLASPLGDISGDGAGDLAVASGNTIYLVDAATGEYIWNFVGNETHAWTGLAQAPDSNDDGKPDLLASTSVSVLMLDGDTGKQLWRFDGGANSADSCSPLIRSVHVISDVDDDGVPDVAVVGGSGDKCMKNDKILVTAFGSEDGAKLWEYSHEQDYYGLKDGNRGSSPAAAVDVDMDGSKDVVVIDDHSVIHAIDGQTGDAIRDAELDAFGTIWDLMAVPDISGDGVEDAIAFEFIEGGGGPDYGSVDAVDLVSAEMIWQAKVGDGQYYGGATYSGAWLPVGQTNYVAVTQRIDDDLHVSVLDAGSGEQVWRFDLGDEKSRDDIEKYYPVARVPNLAGSEHDELAVATIVSRMYLLDGESGNTIWSYPVGGQITGITSVGLKGGQEYIIAEDREGRVYALAGLTEIETTLQLSASTQEITLTPLPDRITLSGKLTPAFRGEIVDLRYVDPEGHVTNVPLILASDGSFTHTLEPEVVGTWKVTAEFEGEGYYLDSKSQTISFTVNGQEIGSSIYRLEVEGSNVSYPIAYKIDGGDVTGMSVDQESKSLDIAISATQDGTLTIRVPRGVVEALNSSYEVFVDGKPANFEETQTDTGFRTLAISFPGSAEHVQVSGTYVVPEFPVALVMMAAISGGMAAGAMYGRRIAGFKP